jgi:TetR/AcrR family transcriptional regulator, cholesterol catabolism regulator
VRATLTETANTPRTARNAKRDSPRRKPGVKREQILDVATDYFGRYGYEDTKWADVAAAVDIGSTALYHYFESKQHCLLVIMADAVRGFRARFDEIVSTHEDWNEALVALLLDGFNRTDKDVLKLRVLLVEHGRAALPRELPREEAARADVRALKRDLEFAYGAFFARGMQQGLIPESDPQLLARAVLGLYNSVWQWFRPGGTVALADVGRFFVERELAIIGADPKLLAAAFPSHASA